MLQKLREERKYRLAIALLIGVVFGFLLQKGGATEYRVIIRQLMLRDFTVLKIIFSAIITGMAGVYLLSHLKIADLSIKPFNVWPVIIGGLVFGVGFALLGYCPGTMAGAFGTGSIHALIGIIGMLIGAGVYASLYTRIQKKLGIMDLGDLTIQDHFDISPWLIIPIMMTLLIVILFFIEFMGF